MVCALSWHRGGRRVFRTRIIYRDDGTRIEGCLSCTDGLLTQVFPADKRWVRTPGSGKDYRISAAHRRDIKMRRVCPDLSHVWMDRKGLGNRVNITNSREFKGAPTGPQNVAALGSRASDYRGKPG